MRWRHSDPRQFVRVYAWTPVSLHSDHLEMVWLEWVYTWQYQSATGRWKTAYCLPEELGYYGKCARPDGTAA